MVDNKKSDSQNDSTIIERTISKYLSLINLFANLLFKLSIVLISLATLLIFFQVVSRSTVGTAPIWINELATYLAVWVVFILMGVLVWWDSHLSIKIVFEKFPEQVQRVLRYFQLIIILVLSTEFILHGYGFATISGFRAQSLALGIDLFWVYVSTFVGGVFLFIFTSAKLLELYLDEDYANVYPTLRGSDIS